MRGDESKDPYFKELFALRLSLFAKTATLHANAGSCVVPQGTRPIQRLFTQHSRAGLDYCLRFAESQHCQGGILGAPRAQYKKAHRFIHPTNPTPGFAGTWAKPG